MTVLKIIYTPDPRLRVVTKPITHFDDPDLQRFIDDMIETMYDANGAGLAATQVGDPRRVAVMDVGENRGTPIVMINPEIIATDNIVRFHEGCLSVPGHYDHLERANWVKVRAQDRHGKVYELEGEGVLAECIQHETDHLNGKLYVDYLSPLKRERIAKKVEKWKRARE